MWIELAPGQFDQPILLSVNVASSVGERGLYASQMGPSWLAAFRRIGTRQVQLVALNAEYSADRPGHARCGRAGVLAQPARLRLRSSVRRIRTAGRC